MFSLQTKDSFPSILHLNVSLLVLTSCLLHFHYDRRRTFSRLGAQNVAFTVACFSPSLCKVHDITTSSIAAPRLRCIAVAELPNFCVKHFNSSR